MELPIDPIGNLEKSFMVCLEGKSRFMPFHVQ